MPRKKSNAKPTGLLAAIADTKKAPTTLLGDIQGHVVKKASLPSDRRQDIIHPSEMAKSDVCPRAIAYRLTGVVSLDKDPNGHHLETIFQEGHDIHSKWQTWLGEMGRLWGKWRCASCGAEEWGVSSDLPLSAGQFATFGDSDLHLHIWEYREVPLAAESELMLVGHADGAVPDIESFIEIKSIGLGTLRMEEPELVKKHTVKTEEGKTVVDYDALWRSLKRPLVSHRKQAGIYLYVANLLWPGKFTKMVFIYENKANQQTKEFTIKYQPDLIDPIIDTIRDIKWAVEKGQELPRPEGFSKQLKPCTSCPFRKHCWGEEEDGTLSQQERDSGTGTRQSGGQAEVGQAENLPANPTRRRSPRTAGGSHRTLRQRTDDPVHTPHKVERVHRGAVGGRGSGRTVRRRFT